MINFLKFLIIYICVERSDIISFFIFLLTG